MAPQNLTHQRCDTDHHSDCHWNLSDELNLSQGGELPSRRVSRVLGLDQGDTF